jgi:calcium-dependent protein kinase
MRPDHPTARAFQKASGQAGAAWDRAFAMLDGRTGVEEQGEELDWVEAFLDNNRGGISEDDTRQPRPPRPASVPAEVRRLCELDHPHVVKLFEYFVDSSRDELLLVQEYLSGGTLLDRVRKEKRLTQDEAAQALREMLSAVACCHAHGLLHADLKPDNFVYAEDGSLKLIDFGLSRDVDIDSRGIRAGNLTFTAPETLTKKGLYGQPADVWALGCMFFLCVTGEHLIEGLCGGEVVTAFGGVKVTAEDDARKAVCDAKAIQRRLQQKARPLLPPQGYDLLTRMLSPDPQQRITALQALRHAFVAREAEFDVACVDKMRRFAALPALVRLAILVEAHEAAGRDVAQTECRTFQALDTDVDGEVDERDLRVAVLKHGGVVDDDLEDVFKRCDLSRNGSLSQSEFIAATMAAGLFGTETYRDAAFVALDADADGLITAKDVARLLAPGSSAASDVLAEIDAGEGCDRATFDALVKAAAASFGGASEAPPAEPAPGTLGAVAALARRWGVGAPREVK